MHPVPIATEVAPDVTRLFLALWPNDTDLFNTLALRSALPRPSSVRWTPPANLHVTLHFLGEIPRIRLAEVTAGLAVAPRRIELHLDHLAVWPGGLAVLTPSQVPAALARLHADLADALRGLQLPVDARPYRPHVTLARRAEALLPAAGPVDPVTWTATHHVLVESAEGRYAILRRY